MPRKGVTFLLHVWIVNSLLITAVLTAHLMDVLS
jgi:hypothetical protein